MMGYVTVQILIVVEECDDGEGRGWMVSGLLIMMGKQFQIKDRNGEYHNVEITLIAAVIIVILARKRQNNKSLKQ